MSHRRRLKQTYFVSSKHCKNCKELVFIHRKPKKRNMMRRIMWRASIYAEDVRFEQYLAQSKRDKL